MTGGLVAKRIHETPVYMEDVVQMTGAVITEDVESSKPAGAESIEVDEFIKQSTGGEGPHQVSAVPTRRFRKARGHSGSKKVMVLSLSGVAPSKPLECVVKGLCLAKGGSKPE